MKRCDRVIRDRHSTRGFIRERQVPENIMREALELAQWAPSNCNVQPWRVFIASGKRRDRLSLCLTQALDSGDFGTPEDPIDTFENDYKRLQIECAVKLYKHMGVGRHDHAGRLRALRRNFEFFDAPHIALVCMDKSYGLGVALDVGMWVQTFMLALEDRSIQSCAQASMRHYPNEIREELSIPPNLRIMCGVSFGYEDQEVLANRTNQSREPLDHNIEFLRE